MNKKDAKQALINIGADYCKVDDTLIEMGKCRAGTNRWKELCDQLAKQAKSLSNTSLEIHEAASL